MSVTAQAPQPPGASTAPALVVSGLDAGYHDQPCVRAFDLSIDPGTVLALVGPNGAGKTTLLLTMAGLLPRIAGDVTVDGAPLSNGNPRDAASHGLVLVPDDRALFTGLTAEENLQAARRKGGPAPRDMLELFPALEQRWKVAAGNLSGGEQQMLAVARGLMRQPTVLLIDELSMGLAPVVVESVLPAVRTIADSHGAAVILVEQHVHLALEIADTAMVLVHGTVSIQGPAQDLAGDLEALEAAYLGTTTQGEQ
ncbi:MAG TPA: ABC transporter ATP-binding protein [Mycobacteriales bacterium]|nr:ABC transporter ATP-binding protein [Mycobacteriales bacterium]